MPGGRAYVVVGSGSGEDDDGDGVGEGDVVVGDGVGDGDELVGDGEGDGEVVVGDGDGDGDDGRGDGDPGDRECDGDGRGERDGTGSTPSRAGVSPSAPGDNAGSCRVPCLRRPAGDPEYAGAPGNPASARRGSPVPTCVAASGLMAVVGPSAWIRAPATTSTTTAAEAARTRGAVRHAGGWAGKPSPPSGPTRSASARE